jgi:hypothetical protein
MMILQELAGSTDAAGEKVIARAVLVRVAEAKIGVKAY